MRINRKKQEEDIRIDGKEQAPEFQHVIYVHLVGLLFFGITFHHKIL